MAGARPIVNPPAFTTLPYGLWDAVQKPAPPARWQQGVTYITRCPVGGTTYDECLSVTGTGEAPPEPAAKTDNVPQEFRGATPFTVFTRFDCSPVGMSEAEEAARTALDRVENQQLEAAFWTGTVGGQVIAYPHLADDTEFADPAQADILLQPAAEVVVGTADDVVTVLGALEQELADCYGGQGVVHIPRSALPTFAANYLVTERDGQLYTPAGNLIVVGGGYPGTSPAGAAPAAGTTWIYVTGAVFGYRGDVFATRSRDSFDRAENTMQMIAERTYVLAFECCLLAGLINLGVPDGAA